MLSLSEYDCLYGALGELFQLGHHLLVVILNHLILCLLLS